MATSLRHCSRISGCRENTVRTACQDVFGALFRLAGRGWWQLSKRTVGSPERCGPTRPHGK